MINLNKETTLKILKEIRKHSDSKKTKRAWEKRFGHGYSTVNYYSASEDHIARIFKTDGKVVNIEIYSTLVRLD